MTQQGVNIMYCTAITCSSISCFLLILYCPLILIDLLPGIDWFRSSIHKSSGCCHTALHLIHPYWLNSTCHSFACSCACACNIPLTCQSSPSGLYVCVRLCKKVCTMQPCMPGNIQALKHGPYYYHIPAETAKYWRWNWNYPSFKSKTLTRTLFSSKKQQSRYVTINVCLICGCDSNALAL